MGNTLLAIPDYSIGALPAGWQAAVGRASVLMQLAPAGMHNADEAQTRALLMQQQAQYQALLVQTPQASYYKRLCAMQDSCFFVDITLRMVGRGARVRVVTGMAEGLLPPTLQKDMDMLRTWGITLDFQEAPFAAPAPMSLVTAKEVERLYRTGRKLLVAASNAVITPSAWDAARDWNITIEKAGTC